MRKGCEKIGEVENKELFVCDKKKERVEALKKGEKSISSNNVLVFERSDKTYLINLDDSELDISNYGIEAVFGKFF